MDKARPIEPGCLAILLRYVPEWARAVNNPIQIIDKDLNFFNHWVLDIENVVEPGKHVHTHERNLIRVDDPGLQKQIEAEREKVCLLSEE